MSQRVHDTMINNLNFGLPETSQYITDRRFVNYFPSGSNVYAPNAGNKNIRFYLSVEMIILIWICRPMRLFATVQNTDTARAKFLRPLAGLTRIYVTLQGNSWWSTRPRYYRVSIGIANYIIHLSQRMFEIWTT